MQWTREQLIEIADLVITAAWDRIESTLPSVASPDELDDFYQHETKRRAMIFGSAIVVAAALPILYARTTDDGMGIGDFPEWEDFLAEVDRFVEDKLSPERNWIGSNLFPPRARLMATQFVDKYLGGGCAKA